MTKQVLAFLSVAALLLAPSYGNGGNMESWQIYSFDGKDFRQGASMSGASVYLKDGFLPSIVKESGEPQKDRLPAGTGGLVVFCYIESIGGKLQNHSGYVPLGGTAVEIRSMGKTITIRSDTDGFIIIALPAQTYEVRARNFMKKIGVEKGKTAFLTIKAGKRMTD